MTAVFSEFTLHVPTRVVFGVGSSKNLTNELRAFKARHALLVTDQGIEKAGIAEKIRRFMMNKVEVTTFNRVEPEPRLPVAEAITQAVRSDKFDAVVGLGGGSALDMAKLASVMAVNPGQIRDYLPQIFNMELYKQRGLPMIMMPTTAGTGSEVSPTSMVIVEHMKTFVTGRWLIPDAAIVDPELTLTMPPRVTAATGLDTLAHCIEGMLSTTSNPITDSLALRAIDLITRNLRKAFADGNNLNARSAMSLAALLGGFVISARMVYGHSIAYTIATRYNLPHGVSTAIPLPYVMEYNLSPRASKLVEIAKEFGENIVGLNEKEAAYRAIFAVRTLIADLKVPTSLKEIGAIRDVLPELAQECVTVYPRPNSPQPMSEEEAMRLYERMWQGQLG